MRSICYTRNDSILILKFIFFVKIKHLPRFFADKSPPFQFTYLDWNYFLVDHLPDTLYTSYRNGPFPNNEFFEL